MDMGEVWHADLDSVLVQVPVVEEEQVSASEEHRPPGRIQAEVGEDCPGAAILDYGGAICLTGIMVCPGMQIIILP